MSPTQKVSVKDTTDWMKKSSCMLAKLAMCPLPVD